MLLGVAVAPGLACVALLAPLAVKILVGAAGGRLNWSGYRLARRQRRRVPALSAAAVARRR
jgi:threonine/homoserine/homoserine lactone efflux protein